jgi:hypothetical protein
MRALYACLFGVLIACGGGDSDSPKAKCEDLLDTVCGRAVECGVGFTEIGACREELEKSNDCSKAEGVGETYDACIEELDEVSCQALFPTTTSGRRLAMPPSCSNAIE